MKKHLVLLLFLTFSIFSLAIGHHHHRDNKPHPECGLCILQHDFSSSADSEFSLILFSDNSFLPYVESIPEYHTVKFIRLSQRYPPYPL